VLIIKERHRYRFLVSDRTLQALRFPEQGTVSGPGISLACLGTDVMARRWRITLAGFCKRQ
jgi:hypothetical protein